MRIRRLSVAIRKSITKQREAVLEMMTDYFINDITNEDAIMEQAEYILHDDFNLSWRKAARLARKFVAELWFDAEFGAQAANDEAQAAYDARESSYADAQAGRW